MKANTLESLIAVIFIDSGLEAALKFVEFIWKDIIDKDIISGDPVTSIQEVIQNIYKEQTPEHLQYKVIRESQLPKNEMEYEVTCLVDGKEYGRGIGSRKIIAKKKAAEKALDDDEFKKKYVYVEHQNN